MFPGLSFSYWLTLHGLVTAVAVLFYVITSHVMQQRRHPAAAIAWIMFILLLPYVALPAYLTFGSRKLARPRSAAASDASTMRSTDAWAIQTLVALGQPAPSDYRDLSIHAHGREALAALLATLDAARHSIDLCTFILARDDIGHAVIERLCQKARSGVRVRLLLDGMGSLMAGRPNLRRLSAAGGAWALFVPPLHSPLQGRTNLRDHRKLLVADAAHDSARLWCGGRNLASEYFEGRPGAPAWHDLSFDLGGALVQQAGALFERDWAFANGRPAPSEAVETPLTAGLAEGAQLVASGPDQVDDTVYSLLVTAAYRARRRIALVTPYFVPESALLMALCLAARRGVTVDLLLPQRSNHRMSDFARGRALRSLAQAGGRVWLAPGMLHAKLAVIDDTLALAGSANIDSRSLFLNYELMVAFHQAADVHRFAAWFERERAPARAYTGRPPGLLRDVAEGMLLWVGFQL
jgi:cardiolipin synthase